MNKSDIKAEIRSTQVDLDGLFEVLGENLYSTPIVAVRELIQNAYDACIRRRIENKWSNDAKIRLVTNAAKNTLTIIDNGCGLTRDEIINYLATIGSGYTRILRNRNIDDNAIGYFGLGFLSAYVVADQVEFITTSFQDENKSWRFVSQGGKHYTIDKTQQRDVGTTVVLHLKDLFSELSDFDFIESIIKKYCCLLPIDIFIDEEDEAVNRIEIPWRMKKSEFSELRLQKASLEFAELFDHSFEPIVTIPISLDDINAQGLLWVQDGSYYASSDNRITTIFIRSMHITDECKELLPSWAGFVGCVIDCATLTPTASRESVKDDEALEQIKERIKDILINEIEQLSIKNDAVWRRLQSRHNQSLLGASVSDARLFNAMHLHLTLPTSEGELTVQNIIQRSGENQLRITMEQGGGYEYLVSKSLGIPVIYGFRYAVMSFCRELCRTYDYKLVTLGSKDSSELLFPEQDIEKDEKETLEKWFSVSKSKTVISYFNPSCLPIIKVFDQDALLKKRIESDELDRHIGSATMMMARQFTNKLEVEEESYLYLNYSNPLIKNFSKVSDDKKPFLSKTLLAITDLITYQNSNSDSNVSVLENLSDNLLKLSEGKK